MKLRILKFKKAYLITDSPIELIIYVVIILLVSLWIVVKQEESYALIENIKDMIT